MFADIPPGDGFPGGGAGMLFVAAFLVIAGVLQFVGAFRAGRGEPRTTIGRQLRAGFGRRGTIAVLVVLGTILVALGVALAVAASGSGGPRRHGAPIPGVRE